MEGGLTQEQLMQLTPLKTKLQSLGHKIKAITDQGRSIAKDSSQLFLFKGMFRKLEPFFDSFNSTWDTIIELMTVWGVTTVFPTKDDKTLQQAIERYYYEGCAIYEQYMNPTPTPASTTTAQSSQNISLNDSHTVRARLPQINLPQFSGNQPEWPLFRDTYLSLIHDETSLSGIEKFLFLVSCLKGPALALIKGIKLEEANYSQAWKLLTETYNDKRRLANSYLKAVLDFPPFKGRPSVNNLKQFITIVGESIDSFKQLKIPKEGDFILFSLMLRCLDPDTRRSFEKKISGTEFPTCQNLLDYIRVEWRSLELSTNESILQCPTKSNSQSFNRNNRSQTSLLVDNSTPNNIFNTNKRPSSKIPSPAQCPACKNSHSLYQCTIFRKASPTEKLAFLKGWSGCTNCLSGKHSVNRCTSHRRCEKCSRNHHSWLHVQQPQDRHSHVPSTTSPSTSGVALGARDRQGEVLLGTTIIAICDANGVYQRIRAVIDSGSQHSFITEDCARRLGTPIEPCAKSVLGIGQSPLTGVAGTIKCSIHSIVAESQASFNVEAIVVSQITGDLPHATVPKSTQALYKSYVLADDEYWKPGPVDFLLGSDLFYDIITGRPISIAPETPRLLPTVFGYILGGPTKSSTTFQEISSLCTQSIDEIKEIMTKFWEVEEVPKRSIISEEEQKCEAHFLATHSRLASGRYVVSLPLKETVNTLVNPSQQAMSRLLNLEAKFERDPLLKEDYMVFMEEYLSLGHMRIASPDTSAYTIPHHAVLKIHNGHRKLRVVFDASCRTKSGSLNDHMYAGPKLQLDIGNVITNFRVHRFVFTTDIIKMYRQILVEPTHRSYQHILWRFDPTELVQEYELCTITYGEKASPFLAQRTIKQLVHDEGAPYPLASKALLEDIYVDDIATGAQTVDEIIQLKEQLIALLDKGGFQLSKWASNCSELLNTLSVDQMSNSCVTLSDEEDSRIKVLGIQWNPREDVFSYELCMPPWRPTKRAILSAIARVYDPLGFLAPVIFYAKILLQELWIAKVGWDEPGPSQICDKWQSFLDQIHCLKDIKIPRNLSSNATQYKLVGFSDASLRGYSAVLYLHAVTSTDCRVSLLKAKTKLSPIKPMTIARLELSGALLLCRLYQSCKCLMSNLIISESIFFTDSTVVLGWLSSPPETLNTFVAHRVLEILEVTQRNQWYHVPTNQNPADCGSRGIPPKDLLNHPLWWTGPFWLSRSNSDWPVSVPQSTEPLPEIKKRCIASLTASSSSHLLEWTERFSSYSKMIRSWAYASRFVSMIAGRSRQTGPIVLLEYRNAEKQLLRLVQGCYKNSDGQVAKVKALRSLCPFVDADGLVRVGGRLQYANLPYNARHPILIPANCHLTKILIDHYHRSYLHLGPTALQNMIRGRYWIVGARTLVRQRVHKCVVCYKAMRSPQAPIMGNLPTCRLQEGQVFAHVGVDYGGPFYIRESSRRKAALGKAYLCLFVCMSTTALHLEVVSNSSTDAFLSAFQRFINRRGKPLHMYSDCGTNFIGAANRLKELLLELRSNEAKEKILQHAVPLEIKWSFNPPSAPHFGGLWEAGIKSCKTILRKVTGETPLTFEELTTLFCRIEGILNSRPLAPIDTNLDNIDCLTPGHFLIGRPLTAIPEEQFEDRSTLQQRWKLIQQKSQHFWQRWRVEYLHHLQQRSKWTNDSRNLSPGDLVIIKEPNAPLQCWPLARVLATHPGKDGVVRVATIKTTSGSYKRPVAKLVPLSTVNPQQ